MILWAQMWLQWDYDKSKFNKPYLRSGGGHGPHERPYPPIAGRSEEIPRQVAGERAGKEEAEIMRAMQTLDYKSPDAKIPPTRWVWRYTRLVPTFGLIHCGLFIAVMFFAISNIGAAKTALDGSSDFFFALSVFPMWYLFNSVPVPIGMFGDGLFWGLGIVGAWHFFSVICKRFSMRG